MAQSPSLSSDPYASIGQEDPYASIGSGDPYAEVGRGESPYAAVIREAQDFQRRVALNATPEMVVANLAREAADEQYRATHTPVSVFGAPVDIPNVIPEKVVPMAARVGIPLAVGIGTSGLGALPALALTGLAGAGSETAAQMAEVGTGQRDGLDPATIAASGALNAIPGLPLNGVASPLLRGGIRVAEGAGLGAAYPVLEAGLRGELANPEDVKQGLLFGGALGVPFGALETVAARQARVTQRLAGKPPDQQIKILDQEVKLAGDSISPQEERVALDLKQGLQSQMDAQKASEAQAKSVAESAKAQAPLDIAPPEPPKSAQILAEPETRPPSVANVATEIATQTKNSPFALQAKLNEFTAVPEPPVAPELPAGRPPVETDPAVIVADRKEYDRLQGELRGRKDYGSPEYNAIWQASEDVKNRHGGMPPEGTYSSQTPEEIGEALGGGSHITPIIERSARIFEKEGVAKGEAYLEQNLRTAFDRADGGEGAYPGDEVFAKTVDEFSNAIQERLGLRKQGEISNAIQERSATPLGEQPIGSQGTGGERGQGMEPFLEGAETPANRVRETPLQEPLSEAQQIMESAPPLLPVAGRPAEATRTAAARRAQRGAVNPAVLAPIAGGVGGAGYGITQGDTPEERMTNALLYGSLGTAGGIATSAVIKHALQKPARSYQSPVLKRVDQMLTEKGSRTPLFEQLTDGYNNLRYRFNTRFAPVGHAQRELFSAAKREFTPNAYYDLERGFERLAGAPVQAEGEVELLQNVVDKLGPKEAPHFDTYLTLERIKDRLLKTDEENARLLDAVGVAQAEFDSAAAKAKANPTERTMASFSERKRELASAKEKLSENYNRKRVGNWSIADAEKGLADLQGEVGPNAYAKLQQAGQEYQAVMRRALDIQVESGRMKPEVRQAVLDSNDFYAPFKVLRHYEEDEPFIRGGGTSRIPSSEQLVKKITGIDDNDVRIGSPTSVAAEQVYKGYILAQKNRKLRELATLSRLDPEGDFVAPLKPDQKPRSGYEAVTYFVGGDPRRIEVQKQLADALTGAGVQETALVMKALGKAGSLFKMGATGLSVPFNVANALAFDPLRLATISKYGFRGPQDFLWTMYEWPRALWSAYRGNIGQAMGAAPDALYEQWIKSGAANSTLARSMTPEAFTGRLPLLKKGVKELYGEATSGLGAPIKLASLISNTLEETTKLLGLQRAMRIEKLDKLSPEMRRKKWDEIVTELRNYAGSPDFSRMGVDMRGLNIAIPFLNPRWQGALADFARINPFRQGNAKDAGLAWARLTGLVGIPTAALTVYNLRPENEKDYAQIPKDDKDRYFHIPFYADPKGKPSLVDYGKGGYYFKNRDGVDIRGYFRIPKRELGGLMANTVEDFVGYAKANDPKTFSEIAADFGDRLFNTASPVSFQGKSLDERLASAASGINPVLRTPAELAFNKNFFTRRDIVPESLKDASPELQYKEDTPEFYKRLAAAVPDFAPEMARSPLRLQHGIESMTGGFARQFAVPRLSQGNPALETAPLLGRFFRSERVEDQKLAEGADAARRSRTDERVTAQRTAQKILGEIETAPPEQRQAIFTRYAQAGVFNNEDVKDRFQDELKDASRGLTYEDRVVKNSYSVAGGHRARYYLDKLSALPPEQRNAYFLEQVNKGLLTKEVGEQMAKAMGSPTPKQ